MRGRGGSWDNSRVFQGMAGDCEGQREGDFRG